MNTSYAMLIVSSLPKRGIGEGRKLAGNYPLCKMQRGKTFALQKSREGFCPHRNTSRKGFCLACKKSRWGNAREAKMRRRGIVRDGVAFALIVRVLEATCSGSSGGPTNSGNGNSGSDKRANDMVVIGKY